MARPVILAVDDPKVLRAVERDLQRKCASEYRVPRADPGESALAARDKLPSGDLSDGHRPRRSGRVRLNPRCETLRGLGLLVIGR
jgi:hypothetical protein